MADNNVKVEEHPKMDNSNRTVKKVFTLGPPVSFGAPINHIYPN